MWNGKYKKQSSKPKIAPKKGFFKKNKRGRENNKEKHQISKTFKGSTKQASTTPHPNFFPQKRKEKKRETKLERRKWRNLQVILSLSVLADA